MYEAFLKQYDEPTAPPSTEMLGVSVSSDGIVWLRFVKLEDGRETPSMTFQVTHPHVGVDIGALTGVLAAAVMGHNNGVIRKRLEASWEAQQSKNDPGVSRSEGSDG